MFTGFVTGGFGIALVNSKSDRHRPAKEAVFIILGLFLAVVSFLTLVIEVTLIVLRHFTETSDYSKRSDGWDGNHGFRGYCGNEVYQPPFEKCWYNSKTDEYWHGQQFPGAKQYDAATAFWAINILVIFGEIFVAFQTHVSILAFFVFSVVTTSLVSCCKWRATEPSAEDLQESKLQNNYYRMTETI